jgi:SAM-dependent methyltransferase
MILQCQQFVEHQGGTSSSTLASIAPDVKRISLIYALLQFLLGDSATGRALEFGSGYGYLLFSLAELMPGLEWSTVEHPGRTYLGSEAYRKALREHGCSLTTVDIVRECLPYPDGHFPLVMFSEVLEHIPVERVNFVLSELARVVCPGGILFLSSPNQASLENRIRLLKGRSILDMPDELAYAKGLFAHIRLYTPAEIRAAVVKRGFTLERSVVESLNSGFRGTSNGGWRRRAYKAYEHLERIVSLRKPLGDTWYMAFRKKNPAV